MFLLKQVSQTRTTIILYFKLGYFSFKIILKFSESFISFSKNNSFFHILHDDEKHVLF
jgi:hypothetical protein